MKITPGNQILNIIPQIKKKINPEKFSKELRVVEEGNKRDKIISKNHLQKENYHEEDKEELREIRTKYRINNLIF